LRADLLTAEGRVLEGLSGTRKALSWHADQGQDPVERSAFDLLIAHGFALAESGATTEAIGVLTTAAEAAGRHSSAGHEVHALTILARARFGDGLLMPALATVNRARAILRELAPHSTMAIPLNLVEVRIRIAGGDHTRAERLVRQLPASEIRTLLGARLAVGQQSAGLARTLAELRTTTPRAETDRQILLASLALRRSSRIAQGHLLKAADLAVREGMALALVGAPPELIDLAETTARHHGHDALSALAEVARRAAHAPGRVTVDLSRGEIELLALLPGRQPNADIAATLGVSVNTVKTRLQRLYRKLGVPGRNDAVKVALVRNLLPQDPQELGFPRRG
jgi:LuxR family transcriptional regulator, maltose regulon positive regulatory protein